MNVLSYQQEDVCRLFAERRRPDKFANLGWHHSPSGSPVIDGSVAWIDCELDDVHVAGDHLIVVGAVVDLHTTEEAGPPLLFFQGGYGRFSTLTLTARADRDLSDNLILADAARPYIERLSARFGVECHATGVIGGDLIQLAYSGPSGGSGDTTKVGLRLPFLPPMGALFVAWEAPSAIADWKKRLGSELAEDSALALERMLEGVRERGWIAPPADSRLVAVEDVVTEMAREGEDDARHGQLRTLLQDIAQRPIEYGKLPYGPMHSISAPVFDRDGRVVLMLTLNSIDHADASLRRDLLAELLDAADEITRSISGVSSISLASQI